MIDRVLMVRSALSTITALLWMIMPVVVVSAEALSVLVFEKEQPLT
jgi:hypothetical protein